MPVKRRKRKGLDDYPKPWEDRPVSFERWERHRERIMAHGHAGYRPEEWWAYESPDPRRDRDERQCLQLYQMGELSPEEIEELIPEWRQNYEWSQHKSFFYPLGPGNFLHGARARRALYRWAGIPAEILEQWDRERVGVNAR
jgi:hypothetical protein